MKTLDLTPSAVSSTRTGAGRGSSSPGAAGGCCSHRTRSLRLSLAEARRRRVPPSVSGGDAVAIAKNVQ
eukprot:11179030-Lingulodinium_polyedra.AAC.1